MAGMEWTVENRYKFNIRAASMSLGGPGLAEWASSDDDSVNRYANEMMTAGIAIFIAAGNNAVSAQIGTPGSAEDAITVGALDKNSAIAVYSSQGPTEEGRVKPNIAYVGSNVMSVAFNTGDQYTAMSGTSMATPGAAGVAALMFQANPDLSPFDIKNIMQETATYRLCVYMAANEPCLEDAIPKNRQNNVYGHGEVRALDAVYEAAERDYVFDTSLDVSLTTENGNDNRIHMFPEDSLSYSALGDVDTIQWRSNHLRDDWSNIHSFDDGDTSGTLSAIDIIHQLEHLPGIDIEGNHTVSLRGIKANDTGGHTSSPLITANIMLMDTDSAFETSTESNGMSGTSVFMGIGAFIVLFILVLFVINIISNKEEGTLAGINFNTLHNDNLNEVLTQQSSGQDSAGKNT
jgi:hypothetical protein